MSNKRRGPTPKRGSRRAVIPDQHWRRQPPEVVVEDIAVSTYGCRYRDCSSPAVRWYLNTDLEERRSVIYPTCSLHVEQAEAWSCGPGCLAPAEGHYVDELDDLMDQVEAAFVRGFGVGFPQRHDWEVLDVIRPSA